MQLGFIGLGKMGSRMVEKLVLGGHIVVAWNRSEEPKESLRFKLQNTKGKENLLFVDAIADMARDLPKPRVFWLMLPAGDPTASMIEEIVKHIEQGDIVIDGGNAHYKDSQRRYETFEERNTRFLGIGVSGGIIAADRGYPLMVGGNRSAYEHILDILDTLARPAGGHFYFGTGGAGHFVKMVHNGIEYGMMQALGEGFGILEKGPYEFSLLDVGRLWQRGTIVSSFLLDRAVDALEKDTRLLNASGSIPESGEAKWTVEQAKEEHVPATIIEESLKFRWQSQNDENTQKTFAARMVNALRHEFGGHEVKK